MEKNVNLADNASRSFKCGQCGYTFSAQRETEVCPSCGFRCDAATCRVMDASDEDF